MRHYLYLILFLITIFSCDEIDKKKVIQGNIYIKLIDVHNILYKMPENKIKEFKDQISNLKYDDYSDSEKKLFEYHTILIEHELFNNPHFKLKTKEGEIINIYTNEIEYSKLKKELNNFDRESEKITLKFEGTKISDGIIDSDGVFDQAIYKTEKIISVKKSEGETDWEK